MQGSLHLTGALMDPSGAVPAGLLDAELHQVSQRVEKLFAQLPNNINPQSLDELRKVKAQLVETENRTETLRWVRAESSIGTGER
jgi:hypothetical protein